MGSFKKDPTGRILVREEVLRNGKKLIFGIPIGDFTILDNSSRTGELETEIQKIIDEQIGATRHLVFEWNESGFIMTENQKWYTL